jgi:D-tyrosyl-tRNA(Tyr) deacylase
MRAVLQRVTSASVEVDGKVVGKIGQGWLILLGIGQGDEDSELTYLADKCVGLRGFKDSDGKMNLAAADVKAEFLIVSQFTLYGDCRKGRRPGFSDAAPAEFSKTIYSKFCAQIRSQGFVVEEGIFQADMKVFLINDGPVTFLLDSNKTF